MSYGGRSCVLFGGVDGTATDLHGQQGTWKWDAQFWTEIQHFGPLGRSGHAMASDVSRQRVVIFGGTLLSGSSTDARVAARHVGTAGTGLPVRLPQGVTERDRDRVIISRSRWRSANHTHPISLSDCKRQRSISR